ncbi:MAG: DUF4402 domain-containing protein [Ignavibacteriaceae bacterium]|jgi:hypothetical protein|nr:DUF4402 domain-containing protein [Ignavibacteriaceae bacterium]
MRSYFTINVLVGLFMLLNPFLLKGQASVRSTANAEVIEALRASEIATLSFGRFSPETAGGEIRISPLGVRTSSGTVSLSGGQYNPASFQLAGQSDATISIVLPVGSVLLTNLATGKTMEVYNFEVSNLSGLGTGVLNNGTLVVSVGATLKVGTVVDNPIGIYSGSYVITFSYN